MQYTFSPRLKMASLVLIVIGVVAYGIGLFINLQNQADPNYIDDMVAANPTVFYGEYQTAEYQELNQTHLTGDDNPQMAMWKNHVSNRPWAAFLVPICKASI